MFNVEKITKRSVIKDVIVRFQAQYSEETRVSFEFNPAYCIKQLEELNLDTCTEEEVIDILNSSWLNIECSVCEEDSKEALVVNPNDDYHSTTICRRCIEKMQLLYVSEKDGSNEEV